MNGIREWAAGRKTYLGSATLATLAITCLVNGWGEAEIAAFATVIAGITASLRAAVANPVVVQKIVILAIASSFLVGCAGFFKTDPETGTSPAEDLQEGVGAFSMTLPAPWNAVVPSITGLVLLAGAAISKGEELDV
jgi:hypothetical protein